MKGQPVARHGSSAAKRHMPRIACALAFCCALAPLGHAAEQVTLTNGFAVTCDHTAAAGTQTLLYMDAGSTNYIAVTTSAIAAVAPMPSQPVVAASQPTLPSNERPNLVQQDGFH